MPSAPATRRNPLILTCILALIAMLPTACTPPTAPAAPPTLTLAATLPPIEVPTDLPRAVPTGAKEAFPPYLKDEIVAFTLDFILQQEIAATADYITNSRQPWVAAPPQANLIVYAPVIRVDYVGVGTDLEHPITVWWFEGGELEALEDGLAAIDRYEQLYIGGASWEPWVYGFYSFGIISANESTGQAEILVNASCGHTCGHGVRYRLRRSVAGKWTITDHTELWVS